MYRDVTVRAMGVSIIGEEDRRDAATYGREHDHMSKEAVEARYAATGDVDCKRFEGQAQLTISNGIVTSAAHVFFENLDCAKPNAIKECSFTVKVEGKPQKYEFEKIMAKGFKCPHTGPVSIADDWIILKLKKKVDSRVKPYNVLQTDKYEVQRNTPVVAVGKSADWPPGTKASVLNPARARHYGDCHTGAVQVFGGTGRIEMDCDESFGASGGSILTRGPNPVLLGMIRAQAAVQKPKVGKDATANKNPCDPEVGKNGRGPFIDGCWSNEAVPLGGAFRDALAEAVEEVPPNDPDGHMPPPVPVPDPPAHVLPKIHL